MQPRARAATERKKALKTVHKRLYRRGIRAYVARNNEATAAM